MKLKVITVVVLTLFLASMLTLIFNVSIVKAETGTIYIRPDGTVDPPTAPIQRDGDIYTFIDNIINETIVVERDDITVDGKGYTFNGTWFRKRGFVLNSRKNVTIKNTHITLFWMSGIDLYYASNNFFFDNNITSTNIRLEGSHYNVFSGNIITYVLEAVWMESSSHNLFSGNTIKSNYRGVWQYYASWNTFSDNNITNNEKEGIYSYHSSGNILYGNNIINNSCGIGLGFSSVNMSRNNIVNNSCGVWVYYSSGSLIYHNTFINNTNQVDIYAAGYANTWDNGYPSGGNYWSDHVCTENPSNGSQPYIIDATNIDHYPFQDPNGWLLPVYNIDTGLKYATIQEAINALRTLDGNTIQVDEGIYYEHVVVNKTVSLIGENRSNTIIDGNGTGTVIYITSDNVSISGFTIQNSGGYGTHGIYLNFSDHCMITGNNVKNNYYGIWLFHSGDCTVNGNNVNNNELTGIYLRYSGNCTIHKNDLENSATGHGVCLSDSANCLVSENTANNNSECGIVVSNSAGCTVTGNTANNNYYVGIFLGNSGNCRVTGNNANKNEIGISLRGSDTSNCVIIGNLVNNNYYGIWVEISNANVIYHNNFIDNTIQVYSYNSINTWDDDYPSGGNYWSNYNDTDSNQDGIGDTLLIIDENNIDNHPLIGMFSNFTMSWKNETYHVTTICNSTISAFNFNETSRLISFNVTGELGIGFCRVSVPTNLIQDLWEGNCTVLVDGQPPLLIKNWADGTNTYLYFKYLHSTHEVTIIPEFPSSMILPLLLILTLIAVIIEKRTLISGVMRKERTGHT